MSEEYACYKEICEKLCHGRVLIHLDNINFKLRFKHIDVVKDT